MHRVELMCRQWVCWFQLPPRFFSKITRSTKIESSAKLGFVFTLPFRHRVQSPKSDWSVSAQSSMREFCYLRQRLALERAAEAHCPLTALPESSTGCFCREQRLNLAYQSNRVSSVQCAFKESMIHQILQFILHFRILPRSSSLREPRGPSLKGVFCLMRFALVTLVSKSKGWFEKKKKKSRSGDAVQRTSA